ncbi:MAG: adenosine kinase [Spirochaetia bacterium]|nr:adenosine kinase [Spirochaetia bacterium]
MKYDVVGIGNALVDIQVQVEDSFIEEVGIQKGAMTLFEYAQQQDLLQKLEGKTRNICSGGSAANTIHGLGAAGIKSYYMGKVANDDFGLHYTQDMANCLVGFPGPDGETSGTGTSVVLITPDAQRTMVTNLGISAKLNENNVDETIIKGAKYVYVEGYLFTGEDTRNAAVQFARTAKKLGIPVAFTLSDAFVVNNFRKEIMDFVQWDVDILFCNEVEGLALSEKNNSKDAFDFISGIANTLFFTIGKEGAWGKRNGEEKIAVNSFPVHAIDTTGAGDLFAAGGLYGLLHNKTLKECCILGTYFASRVITHLGARLPTHTDHNIKKILDMYQSETGQGNKT